MNHMLMPWPKHVSKRIALKMVKVIIHFTDVQLRIGKRFIANSATTTITFFVFIVTQNVHFKELLVFKRKKQWINLIFLEQIFAQTAKLRGKLRILNFQGASAHQLKVGPQCVLESFCSVALIPLEFVFKSQFWGAYKW